MIDQVPTLKLQRAWKGAGTGEAEIQEQLLSISSESVVKALR
jgi:hypothetical protein